MFIKDLNPDIIYFRINKYKTRIYANRWFILTEDVVY